ncbi:molybdopterin converting factor, subunit 2 protein [Besnoitia besnoiti]|uniref:Molybdopterin converting factor, subunit 2 protein n=1 Tax=Besnoitia besnoiti TaxID=94643 RepID=A0A2A9MND5_BESBE|nr:molybdopterin converting factor, subunit 2 protein [Besnoitia besnoiti]PFH37393.1 molybdopterin converting factor, subunit 2 protein [Besnoitia besnoiti]
MEGRQSAQRGGTNGEGKLKRLRTAQEGMEPEGCGRTPEGTELERDAALQSPDGRDWVLVSARQLQVETFFDFVQSPLCGASTVFVGTARATSRGAPLSSRRAEPLPASADVGVSESTQTKLSHPPHSETEATGHTEKAAENERQEGVLFEDSELDAGDLEVAALELECYTAMAIETLLSICSSVRQTYPDIERLAVAHRTGLVSVGEAALIVCVSSPHRAASMRACSLAVEMVKHYVPIWKEEIFTERAAGGHAHSGEDAQARILHVRRAHCARPEATALPSDRRGRLSPSATAEVFRRRRVPGAMLQPLPCVGAPQPMKSEQHR